MGLLIDSSILATIFMFKNFLPTVALVFVSSIFISLSSPSINGAYADYIEETKSADKEIEGLQDFFTNLGFIIGPIMAGGLFDLIGGSAAFSVLGILGAIAAIILIIVTPKHIKVNLNS